MCTGWCAESTGRVRCDTQARSPTGLRPAPRRAPPHVRNASVCCRTRRMLRGKEASSPHSLDSSKGRQWPIISERLVCAHRPAQVSIEQRSVRRIAAQGLVTRRELDATFSAPELAQTERRRARALAVPNLIEHRSGSRRHHGAREAPEDARELDFDQASIALLVEQSSVRRIAAQRSVARGGSSFGSVSGASSIRTFSAEQRCRYSIVAMSPRSSEVDWAQIRERGCTVGRVRLQRTQGRRDFDQAAGARARSSSDPCGGSQRGDR